MNHEGQLYYKYIIISNQIHVIESELKDHRYVGPNPDFGRDTGFSYLVIHEKIDLTNNKLRPADVRHRGARIRTESIGHVLDDGTLYLEERDDEKAKNILKLYYQKKLSKVQEELKKKEDKFNSIISNLS